MYISNLPLVYINLPRWHISYLAAVDGPQWESDMLHQVENVGLCSRIMPYIYIYINRIPTWSYMINFNATWYIDYHSTWMVACYIYQFQSTFLLENKSSPFQDQSIDIQCYICIYIKSLIRDNLRLFKSCTLCKRQDGLIEIISVLCWSFILSMRCLPTKLAEFSRWEGTCMELNRWEGKYMGVSQNQAK